MSEMTIRPAVPEDIPLILSFIRELAAYEKTLAAETVLPPVFCNSETPG